MNTTIRHAALTALAIAGLTACGGSETAKIAERTKGFDLELLPARFTVGHRPAVGYCNADGDIELTYKSGPLSLFHDGLAHATTDEGPGFIDKEGELKVDISEYKTVGLHAYFSEGMFLIDAYGGSDHFVALSPDGEVLFECAGRVASQMRSGYALFAGDGDRLGVIDSKGNVVYESSDDEYIWYGSRLYMATPASCAHPTCFPICNATGRIEYFLDVVTGERYLEGLIPSDFSRDYMRFMPISIDSNDRVVLATREGFGLLKLDGTWVVEPSYEEIYNDGDWYLYREDGLYGWLDKDGEIVIPARFKCRSDEIGFGGSDWAYVGDNTFIDRKGEIVLETEYDVESNFIGDRCLVELRGGSYGWIDRNGELISSGMPLSPEVAGHISAISLGKAIQYSGI